VRKGICANRLFVSYEIRSRETSGLMISGKGDDHSFRSCREHFFLRASGFKALIKVRATSACPFGVRRFLRSGDQFVSVIPDHRGNGITELTRQRHKSRLVSINTNNGLQREPAFARKTANDIENSKRSCDYSYGIRFHHVQ
jgi:hypothetical protein